MPTNYLATKPKAEVEVTNALKDPIAASDLASLESWIDSDITDMCDVRDYLKRLTRVVRANQVKRNKYQKN